MKMCTTLAIAVISQKCGAFTTLPALMNEYRVPMVSLQTTILKTISFMINYIGSDSKDYTYAISSILEHALQSQNVSHKQIAI